MKKKDLKEMVKQEIESEASALERRVNTKKSLASLEMPEDSYDELMERIREKKRMEMEMESEFEPKSSVDVIPFRARSKKALATVAMVVVLVGGVGLGVQGARLYMLSVERQEGKSSFDIITDTEDIRYLELTEKEAYEKLEEKIGIHALRITDRPKGLVLEKVYIDSEMGEAVMEFYYDDGILSVYENKQNANASFQTKIDGEVVDKIDAFYLGKDLEILKVDKAEGDIAYQVQLEYGNAFYHLVSDMELEEFKVILNGIIFIND